MKRHIRNFRRLVGGSLLYAALLTTAAIADPLVNIEEPVATQPMVLGQTTRINVSVELEEGDESIVGVNIYVNDNLLGAGSPGGGLWGIDYTPTTLGAVSIRAEAIDEASPPDSWFSDTFFIDVIQTDAPEVSILAPADNSHYLPGTNLPVQVLATDNDGLIQRVDFFLNAVFVSSVGSAPFRTEIQLPSIGEYTLTARAYDNSGAQANSQEINLVAGPQDESTPRVVIDFPLPLGNGDTVNDVSYASAMFLNATAVDPDGFISDVIFYINGQELGSAEHSIGDVYSFFFDPNALGNYVISAKAIDDSGNEGWSVPLVLDVGPLERPLPKAEMIQPFPESVLGRVVPLFVEADGGLIQIDRVDFFANGVFLGSVDEPIVDNLYSYNWTPEEPGDYAIQTRVVQIDPAEAIWDNWKISASVDISITEPGGGSEAHIELINPANGSSSIVLRPIMLQANALDPLGSITEVRFYVNGTQLETVDTIFPYSLTYVPQSPGQFLFVAEMLTDRGLRVHSDPVTVNVVVTDLPTGSFVSPGEVFPTAGSTVPITIEASDEDGYVQSVEFWVNGEEMGLDNSSPFTVFWTPQSQGIYDLTARIRDNSGNEVLLSRSVTVVPPTGIVPRVTMSVTGSGNVTPGSRVVVLANVYDDTPDDMEVSFFLNGAQIGPIDKEAPYSVIVDPEIGGGVFGNAYSLTALATDPDGNSRADTLDPLYISDFSVDHPSIRILNLSDGDNYTRGSRVPIRVEVGGGAAQNLSNVVFYADGVEIGRVPAGEVSGRYSFDWVPERSGIVEVTAASLLREEFYDHDRDSGGLNPTPMIPVTPVNVAFPVNINVNEPVGTLPSISLDVFPTRTNLAIGSKVMVYADAQDLGGAVEQVEFFYNGIPIGIDTEAPFTHILTTTHPGNIALNALATDSDGNVVTSTVVNLDVMDRVVTQTPSISLTVPSSGQQGNPLSLRASTASFVSGPESVVFYVNGQPVGEDKIFPYSFTWLANLTGDLTFFSSAQQTLFDGTIVTTVSDIVESFLTENLPPEIGSFSVSFPGQDPIVKPNPVLGNALTFTVEMSDTGPISSVELLRDGESINVSNNSSSPFEIVDFPPGTGNFQYSVLVTDRGGLQSQSGTITVKVDPSDGGPVDPEGSLPVIQSFTSDVVGGSSLVNLPITFTIVASDEKGIERVELFQNGGTLVSTVFSEPYVMEFLPTEAGNYVFKASVTNIDGNSANSESITINVRQPNPLGENTDFVYQTFLDLLLRAPTLQERNSFSGRIESGDLSRDRFIREIVAPVSGADREYDAVRDVLLANRFLLGQWPSRSELDVDVGTVRDGGLNALISSLMPYFEPVYVGTVNSVTGLGTTVTGVPDILSTDAEINAYITYLFVKKYGVKPTTEQLNLAKLHFRSTSRDAFTSRFIEDIEVIATSQGYITVMLGFKFAAGSPPSDTYLREADAASLMINLLRATPAEGEVTALSQKLFASQVSEVLADPRYSARFSTAFSTLEHYPNNWKHSEWFGWFNVANSPWIYHSEHGWVAFQTVGQSSDNFWYYDSSLGWTWTRDAIYPVIYEQAKDTWLMGTRMPYSPADGRWFFDFGINNWIKL